MWSPAVSLPPRNVAGRSFGQGRERLLHKEVTICERSVERNAEGARLQKFLPFAPIPTHRRDAAPYNPIHFRFTLHPFDTVAHALVSYTCHSLLKIQFGPHPLLLPPPLIRSASDNQRLAIRSRRGKLPSRRRVDEASQAVDRQESRRTSGADLQTNLLDSNPFRSSSTAQQVFNSKFHPVCGSNPAEMLTERAAKTLWNSGDSEPVLHPSLTQTQPSKRSGNGRQADFLRDKKLDSNLFETLLEELWKKAPKAKRSSCVYLDCLWFVLYKDAKTKAKVLGWIKKKQIFSKRFIFVPIVCWSHWSLLILCNFGVRQSRTRKPCMLLLDSLQQTGPERLEPDIRRFVFDIYKSEQREVTKDFVAKIPLFVPKVPQQKNGEECGIYVLYFIYLFMQTAHRSYRESGCPYFLNEDWFKSEELENFCNEILSVWKREGIIEVQQRDQHSSVVHY